jgi:hypothetical protein
MRTGEPRVSLSADLRDAEGQGFGGGPASNAIRLIVSGVDRVSLARHPPSYEGPQRGRR